MKMKSHYEDEINAKLKVLEEEYELMMSYNSHLSDTSTIAAEHIKTQLIKNIKRRII